MNPPTHPGNNDDIRPEYDFSQGVPGKHYEAYRAGTNVVFLEPDLAKVFTDSASVNQVLRLFLEFANKAVWAKSGPNKALQPTEPPSPQSQEGDHSQGGSRLSFLLRHSEVAYLGRREINPKSLARDEDWEGNKAAFTCPKCGKVSL